MNRLGFLILVLLSSCHVLKNTSTTSVFPLSTTSVLKKVEANQLDYDWFSAKMTGTAFIKEKAVPLNANLRIKKDSVIWISASAVLGLEAVRALITPDSIKFINRLNSTYYQSDISSLSTRYGIDFDFYQLQNLLMGHWSLGQNSWNANFEENNIVLNYQNQQNYKRAKIDTSFYVYDYVESFSANDSIWLNYTNFSQVDQYRLPSKARLNFVKESNSLRLRYDYSKISINQAKKIRFSIPKGYEKAI